MLGSNYSNGSIVSVDMDVVGVMAAYLPVVRVCTAQSIEALCVYCTVYRGTVCAAQSIEALCVYCTVYRGTVCTAQSIEARPY